MTFIRRAARRIAALFKSDPTAFARRERLLAGYPPEPMLRFEPDTKNTRPADLTAPAFRQPPDHIVIEPRPKPPRRKKARAAKRKGRRS